MADRRLIPDGIKDESTLAYNELIERLGTLDLVPLLVYIIDNVDASALVHLADQFSLMGLDGWSLAETEEQKRALIKSFVELHKYKGTKYALLKVLQVLGLDGLIEEWFEYQGDPFYFRVKVYLYARSFSEETADLLERMINEYKNVRSWLDQLIIYISTKANIYIGAVMQIGETITTYPYDVSLISGNFGVPFFCASVTTGEIITTYPYAEGV